MKRSARRTFAATLAAATALTISACASEDQPAPVAEGAFPVTVVSCSTEVTFDKAPERIIVFRNEVIPVLSSLGVLDRVVGLVGQFHGDYFDADTQVQMAELPVLSDEISQVGGGEVSVEDIIAADPDLVIGIPHLDDGGTFNGEALAAEGIQVLDNEESCEGSQATSTLDDIDTLFTLYGDVFDRSEEAEAALEEIDQQIAAVTAQIPDGETRTAAMLYPTIGGGTIYAYGAGSMNNTLLELAGFTNVFADTPDRTFEVSTEQLVARDPDVLILLHSGASDEDVESAITMLPGAEDLAAVKNGDTMPLLFGFTSPASPITIDGLEQIVERFNQ